jgi:acyl-CoA synthetase (AMP-forming)/AMP-acid ligase II
MTRWADRTLTSCYDKYLLFGPITGPTPRGFALTAHLRGADFIMLAKFSEEAMCRITEEERVTMWVGHPVMMVATFNSPYFSKYDMSSLRAWAWAGALIPTSIRYKLWDMGIKTFASGGAISAACENMQGGGEQLYKKKIMCESYGQAKRGMEMKIVDPKDKKTLVKPGEVGEIAYRGPTFGAWRNPEYNKETFDEEGWEWDGDYATWDEEENITWVGRPENVTIKGGKIIGPIDIESALLYNPKIAQAVAAPVPAKEKEVGHRVCLYVVPKAGETITLEELREYLRAGGIDDFALPERLEILDKMPLSAGGKVDYVTLGKLTEEKLKAEGKI